MKAYQHYIGGEQVEASGGETFETINPYTGEAWATMARGTATDVDAAVATATAAFEGWATTTPTARGRLLLKLADIIEREAERLGEIEVRDNGKLIAEMARPDQVPGRSGTAITAASPTRSKARSSHRQARHLQLHPLRAARRRRHASRRGTRPCCLLRWKLAPALAAGNTAVVKPSEFTSASTLEFMKL